MYLNIVFAGQNNRFQDLTNLTVGVHFPQESLGDQLHKTRKKIITVYTAPTSNTRKKGFQHREGRLVQTGALWRSSGSEDHFLKRI